MTLLDTRLPVAEGHAAEPRVHPDLRRLLLAAFATGLSVTALVAVVELGAWLPKALAVAGLMFVLGAAGRALRLPRPVVAGLQAVVGLCVVVAMQASTDATWNFVPGPGALEDLFGTQWNDGIGELTRLIPPDKPSVGITTVLVVSAVVTAIVVDACAASYRRPDLAGLVLVVVYAVPAATLPNGWRGSWFVLPAIAFLLLAINGNSDRIRTWGDETIVDTGGGARRSVKIGATIIVLSLTLPPATTAVTGSLFNNSGIGLHVQEPIKPLDPLTVMRKLLVRVGDVQMFGLTTDSAWPSEQYLHAVTLQEFNGRQWVTGNPSVKRFDGAIPDTVGSGPTVTTVPFEAEVTSLPDTQQDYVPMPRPAQRIEIKGDWRLTPTTSDILSADGVDQIGDRSWKVTGFDRDPDANAIKGKVPTDNPLLAPYLQLPTLSPILLADARRITKGSKDAVEIGRRLQDYFANPKNTFYDQEVTGSGQDAILAYLNTKHGYAEQTASTMAVMARLLGVPSRLAVGFTAGSAGPGGTWKISAHDSHAWPELFLPEVGWTRFEPTPARAPGNPKPLHWLLPPPKEKPPAPNEKPQEQPPPPPQALPPQVEPLPNEAPPPPPPGEPNTALRVMLGSLFLLLLLCAPRILRTAITRRRWVRVRPKGTDGAVITRIAWLELRDAAVDLGYAWPATRTPRQAGRELTEKGHLTPETVAVLDDLLHNVEQVRYAPPASMRVDAFAMRSAVVKVRWELAAAAPPPDRVRAWVLPRSLVPFVRDAAKAVATWVTKRQKPAGKRRAGVSGRRLVR
ncbi:MAG: transglutaminase family protein [Sporichthyaceae bacterium]